MLDTISKEELSFIKLKISSDSLSFESGEKDEGKPNPPMNGLLRSWEVLKKPWRFSFFLVAAASLSLNGTIYVWPQYTRSLRGDHGLSESQVVLLGVISQASMGIFQFPFHVLNQFLSTRYAAVTVDRIMVGVAGGSVSLGTLLLGFVFLDPNPPIEMLIPLTLLYASGIGNTYSHVLSVCNFQLMSSQVVRKVAIAQLSVVTGMGGAVFSMIYHYLLSDFPISTTYFLLAGLQMLMLVLRGIYLIRDKETREKIQQEDTVIYNKDPEAENLGSAVRRATWHEYSTSKIVWLTCICTSFGLAVTSVWLSSLGNMAIYLDEASNTYTLTLTFLLVQTSGRVVTAFIYAWNEIPYILTLWLGALLAGVIVVVVDLSITSLYVTTILVALSMGGIWSTYPVIVSTSFPGDPSYDLMKGMACVYFFITIVGILFSQFQNVLIGMGRWTMMTTNKAYLAPFILFLVVALLTIVLSILLGLSLASHTSSLQVNIDDSRSSKDTVTTTDVSGQERDS